MARASISHIALTVSDLDRSTEFYDKIFRFMGYMVAEEMHPAWPYFAPGDTNVFARPYSWIVGPTHLPDFLLMAAGALSVSQCLDCTA